MEETLKTRIFQAIVHFIGSAKLVQQTLPVADKHQLFYPVELSFIKKYLHDEMGLVTPNNIAIPSLSYFIFFSFLLFLWFESPLQQGSNRRHVQEEPAGTQHKAKKKTRYHDEYVPKNGKGG